MWCAKASARQSSAGIVSWPRVRHQLPARQTVTIHSTSTTSHQGTAVASARYSLYIEYCHASFRSTQPSCRWGDVAFCPLLKAFRLNILNGDDLRQQAGSQRKWVALLYIHRMHWVNFRNYFVMMTAT